MNRTAHAASLRAKQAAGFRGVERTDGPVYSARSSLRVRFGGACWGGVLAAQQKFQEAEPLLVEGYSGMKEREANIPRAAQPRLAEAIRRLVDLYTAWDKPEEAAKWQAVLDESAVKSKSNGDD